MWKITHAQEQNNHFLIQIEYNFANSENTHQLEITAKNPILAHSIFANNAITFIQSSLDELYCELQKIRPNYFDNSSKPYVGEPYNQMWTIAYWSFLQLREKLSNTLDPIAYIKVLNLFNFNPLIPVFLQLNHEVIKSFVLDIKKTAELVLKSINKIQNNGTPALAN